MTAVDEILHQLPITDLARRLDAQPDEVQRAAAAVLPALLGGLQANASDPAGAASIVDALPQHVDGVRDDGDAIARHIFGSNQDQVAQQLGGLDGVGGPLVQRLIPILAPVVMAWLARKVLGQAGAGGSLGDAQGGGQANGSVLQDVLGSVLGAATGQTGMGTQTGQDQRDARGFDTGSVITQVLGGLLGGGRR